MTKIIEDFRECLSDIEECLNVLDNENENKLMIKLAMSSMRNLFVSYHTILEEFCSIMLKEMNKYKIGMTLHESFEILNECGIINDELRLDLDKSRLVRNRIFHRYKEPTNEDLVNHVKRYKTNFEDVVLIAKKYL